MQYSIFIIFMQSLENLENKLLFHLVTSNVANILTHLEWPRFKYLNVNLSKILKLSNCLETSYMDV